MNLYEELELPRDCSFEEIKQQYRHLANVHHPDKGGSTERFKRIKFAYEVLSSPDRRKLYDETNTTQEPPKAETEAITQLSTVFFSVIANIDLHAGNLIDTMRNEIIGESMRNEAAIVQCIKHRENLNVAKQKLIHKKPQEENLLLGFIETQIATRNNDMKSFLHRKETLEHMLKLLEDYQYGFMELAAAAAVPDAPVEP
jgi:curved DNA-binding protein CbpA